MAAGLGSILSLLRLGNVGPVPTDIYGNDPRYKYRTPPFVPEDISGPMDPIIPPVRTIFGSPIEWAPGQEPSEPQATIPQVPRPAPVLPEPPEEEKTAISQMYDLLQRVPKREDYKPSWLRRIFAIPQEYMRPGAGETFKELPWTRAMAGWKGEFEPVSKAATEERYRNINERQIWAQQYGILKGQQELAIRQQDADVRKYKSEHPNHILGENEDGWVYAVNPQDPTKTIYVKDSSGNPIRQLSERTKIELGIQGRLDIVNKQQEGALKRVREQITARYQTMRENNQAAMQRLIQSGAQQRQLEDMRQVHREALKNEQLRGARELALYREQLDRETRQMFPTGGGESKKAIDVERDIENLARMFRDSFPELAEDSIEIASDGTPHITAQPGTIGFNAAWNFIYRPNWPAGVPVPAGVAPIAPVTPAPTPAPPPTTPTTAPPTAAPPPAVVPPQQRGADVPQQDDEVLIRNKKTGVERYMLRSNLPSLAKFPDWEVVRQ
jgi:hypothetical protein